MKINNPKIYLGLTTTRSSNWREKIKEIKKMAITEIALFPTTLNPRERQELYLELENTPIEYIPFVHLRHDSTQQEIEYLKNKYDTKLFNIHSTQDALANFTNYKDKNLIYIENGDRLEKEFFDVLDNYAGVCLDMAHWEDYGILQKDKTYQNFPEVLKNHKIGFSHVSTVRNNPYFRHYDYHCSHERHYSAHLMEHLEDLDYLKKYREYLPEICGLELENSLTEQLEAKRYIEENILK